MKIITTMAMAIETATTTMVVSTPMLFLAIQLLKQSKDHKKILILQARKSLQIHMKWNIPIQTAFRQSLESKFLA